jgi:hypothetical protein
MTDEGGEIDIVSGCDVIPFRLPRGSYDMHHHHFRNV